MYGNRLRSVLLICVLLQQCSCVQTDPGLVKSWLASVLEKGVTGKGLVAWFSQFKVDFGLDKDECEFSPPLKPLSPIFLSFWSYFCSFFFFFVLFLFWENWKSKPETFYLKVLWFFFLNTHSFFLSLSMTPWKAEEEKETVKLFYKACYAYEIYLSFLPRSNGIFQAQPEGQRWGSSEIFPNHAAKEMSRSQISFSQHRQHIGYPSSKLHQAWGEQTLPKLHCFPLKPPHDLTFAFWGDLLYTQE